MAMCRIHRGNARPDQQGFTLPELMIVVAIIGILASIAYPAYTDQVKRGKRTDAQTVLLEAAQYMQRYYIAKNTFEGADLEAGGLNYAPKGSSAANRNYDISVDIPLDDPRSFELTADPVFVDETCGNLTLTHTGSKGKSGTGSVADCWK